MARTTEGEVLELLETGGDYDSFNQPSLSPFVESATMLVDQVVACATRKGLTPSSTQLELVERWLAAHFYCVTDRVYSENKTGDSSAKYAGKTEKGLESTPYGQSALDLDTTGCLNSIMKKNRARVLWLGKPPSEQIDYIDRD